MAEAAMRARAWEPGESVEWASTETGLLVPTVEERPGPWDHLPTGLDLFAGAGGFSLGFMQAGFRVLAGADNDANATITYMHNLGAYPATFHFVEPEDRDRLNRALERDEKGGMAKAKSDAHGMELPMVSGAGHISNEPDLAPVEHFFFGDVRKLTGEYICHELGIAPGDLGCVFGGPPCQGFSRSGKRHIADPRNTLVFEFTRLVNELRPKTLVFENVPGILDMVTEDGIPIVDALALQLEEWGTYAGVKNSLLASSGAGTALQTSKREKERPKQSGRRKTKGSGQSSLFDNDPKEDSHA